MQRDAAATPAPNAYYSSRSDKPVSLMASRNRRKVGAETVERLLAALDGADVADKLVAHRHRGEARTHDDARLAAFGGEGDDGVEVDGAVGVAVLVDEALRLRHLG